MEVGDIQVFGAESHGGIWVKWVLEPTSVLDSGIYVINGISCIISAKIEPTLKTFEAVLEFKNHKTEYPKNDSETFIKVSLDNSGKMVYEVKEFKNIPLLDMLIRSMCWHARDQYNDWLLNQ